MPTPELMTWVPAQRRWTKMYCGQRYYVSARQLAIKPETKEATLAAANAWWRDKQAEIDYARRASLQARRTPMPAEDLAAASLGGTADFPTAVQELAARLAQDSRGLFGQHEPPPVAAPLLDMETLTKAFKDAMGDLLVKAVLGGGLPEIVRETLSPARVAQLESSIKGIRGETSAEPERAVNAMAEEWMKKQEIMVRTGDITAPRAYNVRRCLNHLVAFLGEIADVSIINAERLEGFHFFCLSKVADGREDRRAGWSTAYAREVFSNARRFVRWLWERGAIELPANLNTRWRFGPAAVQIETWTVEEVQHVIGEAGGKLKLALLLMANCGMTQKDVSDLRDAEVNWHDGRVTRKRSKTGNKKNTPTVCYKLWPQTFALLKQYRSGQDRVLLTKTGKAYVRKNAGGDMFSHAYDRLRDRLGFKKPMKLLRKTAASMLETHETYGRFTSLFLGHAPSSIKDRHYAAPPQDLFDSAVRWLGEQFGFVDRV